MEIEPLGKVQAFLDPVREKINEIARVASRPIQIVPSSSGYVSDGSNAIIIKITGGGVPDGYTEYSDFMNVEGTVREFKILAKLVE